MLPFRIIIEGSEAACVDRFVPNNGFIGRLWSEAAEVSLPVVDDDRRKEESELAPCRNDLSLELRVIILQMP